MIADFLQRLRPAGSYVLTAIVPDGKTDTQTFTDAAKAEAWALDANKKANLYLHVNPTIGPVNRKATKEQIAALEFLHVDLDPRTGEDFAQERARILSLLTTKRPEGIPAPTLIVDSGGGYQAWWRLSEPLPINGDVAKAEEAERWNRALERAFGADNCHDCSRLLRLPGSTNWPNKKKRDKGRTATDAEVYDWPKGADAYPLSAFRIELPTLKGAAAPATASRKASNGAPVAVGASVSVDELRAWAAANGKNIPDLPLAVLVHGRDFDPAKYPSRSEALWAVVCGLVRAGLPDDLIEAAILNPDNRASACVLDKQRPASEARDQVQKAHGEVAHEEAEQADPTLAEMNAAHAVLTQAGGKTRVLCWEKSELDEAHLMPVLQTFDDFRNRYLNRVVQVGTDKAGNPIYKKRGHWWLEHPNRREYKALRLMPGQPEECDGYLNLWRGWGVEPEPGDWSLLRAHIVNVIAKGNEAHASYVLRWMAWATQNPDRPAEVALVLRGGKGTGKGFFGRALCTIFGQHSLQIGNPAHLTGRFNAHLRSCLLLFCDEASTPGDRAGESVLKTLVTEASVTVESKYIDATSAKNRLKIVMASNDDWVVPASLDERRFAVFDMADNRAQDHAYFAALAAEAQSGGLGGMLHELQAMDLGRWHPRSDVPETDALLAQKAESLHGVDAVLLDLLREGSMPGPLERHGGAPFVATSDLLAYVQQRTRSLRGPQRASLNDVAAALESIGAEPYRKPNGGPRGFSLPSLSEARERWCQTRMRVTWNDADDWANLDQRSAF